MLDNTNVNSIPVKSGIVSKLENTMIQTHTNNIYKNIKIMIKIQQ